MRPIPQARNSNSSDANASPKRPASRKLLTATLALTMTFASGMPAEVGAAGLIRDAETENLLRSYARPIFNVAGLGSHNVQIHLVSDKSFNAFVIDGQNIIIHVGAIMNSKTPNQLIGVIAHEAGHITGGHLARLRSHLKRARTASLMLQILGIAAVAAGASAGGGNDLGEAGSALLQGGSSVLQRSVLAYRRAEESSADQAALTFLNATRQSAKGMLRTFEYFSEQGLGSLRYANPYAQSHPMPQQRITQLRTLAKRSPYYRSGDAPTLQLRHDLVRAKLSGFLEKPATVFNKYPNSDQSLPARYARAIATYRSRGIKRALPLINALLKERPRNPYFHEIKGQFLFESGQPKQALPSLRRAVELAPKSGLIQIMLGQALLATGKRRYVDTAVKHLRRALVSERRSANGYRQLANAYARKKRIADAELASAQAYFYEGKLDLARTQAKRAKAKFPRGTPPWVKADDILTYKPPTR